MGQVLGVDRPDVVLRPCEDVRHQCLATHQRDEGGAHQGLHCPHLHGLQQGGRGLRYDNDLFIPTIHTLVAPRG